MEFGRWLFAQPCDFVTGAVRLDQLPETALPEVAFAGRSNVGKSSLINALTGRKTLARTSNMPGRTREINFFLLAERLMLVDLPGYGYARAAKHQIQRWNQLITKYLKGRPNLCRVCLLIDARRGIMDADEAKRHGKNADNLARGFRISGLGQLIEAAVQADRLVSFGD